MINILDELVKELNCNVDEKYKVGSQNFFKENVKILGVRVPVVRRISRKYFQQIKHLSKDEIFVLCEKLLKMGYNECCTIAFSWALSLKKQFSKDDFIIFESWLGRYVSNWASCDDLCTHILGLFLFKFPDYLPVLNKWSLSDNRWLRRASAVSLIYPVRKGKYLDKIFVISDVLLKDKEDLVQKGYGWSLKESTKLFESEVFDFVMARKDVMPRTALRYAIEKMPVSLKKKAMS